MRCDDVRRLLAVDAEELLHEAVRSRLEAHLVDCSSCRAQVHGMDRVNAGLRSLCAASGSEERLVQAAITKYQATRTVAPSLALPLLGRRWGMTAVFAAASVAAIAATLVVLNREEDVTTNRNSVPPAEAVPIGPPVAIASTPMPLPTVSAVQVTPSLSPQMAKSDHRQYRRVSAPTSLPKAHGQERQQVHVARPSADASVRELSSSPVEDDLTFVNGGTAGFARRWTSVSESEAQRILADVRASVNRGEDFVEVEAPLVAANGSGEATRAALARYRYELQIVDARLQRRVTLTEKGIPFGDLCKKLREETGISFSAARNVMDDKVTVFCKDRPLRDVMRQITALFNFTWERTGDEDNFSYRLKQPLSAALLEEELRNKDLNEALLALDREMEAVESLLNLSPAELAQRFHTTTDEKEKQRLMTVLGLGRGPAQLYTLLSADELTGLRNGQRIRFSAEADGNERPIPPDIANGILKTMAEAKMQRADGGPPLPPVDYSQANATADLWTSRDELGQIRLYGVAGAFGKAGGLSMSTLMAEGISPSARDPKNAEVNAARKNDPELQSRVSIVPTPSCQMYGFDSAKVTDTGLVAAYRSSQPKVTTADVLEAVHQATGMDVIGDYYTRVYSPEQGTAQNVPLFEALCQIADSLHLRWNKDAGWLGFRSVTFFYDRQKEIPARQLERWAAARKRNGGYLSLRELLEIARLSDAQRNSGLLADGVRALYGLYDWDLVRNGYAAHLRFLAALSPNAQQATASAPGLSFARLSLPEQQAYLDAMGEYQPVPLDSFGSATLLVESVYKPLKETPGPAEDGTADKSRPKDEHWPALRFDYLWVTPGGEPMQYTQAFDFSRSARR